MHIQALSIIHLDGVCITDKDTSNALNSKSCIAYTRIVILCAVLGKRNLINGWDWLNVTKCALHSYWYAHKAIFRLHNSHTTHILHFPVTAWHTHTHKLFSINTLHACSLQRRDRFIAGCKRKWVLTYCAKVNIVSQTANLSKASLYRSWDHRWDWSWIR